VFSDIEERSEEKQTDDGGGWYKFLLHLITERMILSLKQTLTTIMFSSNLIEALLQKAGQLVQEGNGG